MEFRFLDDLNQFETLFLIFFMNDVLYPLSKMSKAF